MSTHLRSHAEYAAEQLQCSRHEIETMLQTHRQDLTQRQCQTHEMSARIQRQITMLCTSLYASGQDHQIVQDAAVVLCQDLRRELTGNRPSDDDWRTTCRLGEAIVETGFPGTADAPVDEFLMPYE